MKANDTKTETKPLSLLSLFLSFMALFVISALLFAPINSDERTVLIGLDFIICSLFLLQLFIDLIRSTDRLQFMKTHWIDFVASVPMIEPLRFARVFHIFRVILVIRSGEALLRQLARNKHETTIASILLLLILLITAGAGLMLWAEGDDPEANIQHIGDAVWWAFVTVSTVGYGDHYPVTGLGKALAGVIIICGVGLFGMTSGLITSLLSSPSSMDERRSKHKEVMLQKVLNQQEIILHKLEKIERKMDSLDSNK
ncbi:capsular biosynthesis protein [Vibrio mediterranei]|uniref:Ion transporter n=1 Tax=Vibrio mediterranei TaxID=689 RepID=A0A3G4V875_9VIBR|nr:MULTISPECIES: potassium channel family protein [Vibrio]AYV20983.1 ion transporter [Vibrio mediterranei]EDL52981.1 putative potassium channel protein [Vibrio mediterranei AK1]MDA0110182.1 ion transporter [Vibrio sp. La 4.2.2]NUW73623.1 potassium channel family protein [Vibrio mediterranei]PTC03546.1 capsular biosynthesis protein [Vibrio mediterranei]